MKRVALWVGLVVLVIVSGVICLAQTSTKDAKSGVGPGKSGAPQAAAPSQSASPTSPATPGDRSSIDHVIRSVLLLNKTIVGAYGGKIAYYELATPPVEDCGEKGVRVTGLFYTEGCREMYQSLVAYPFVAILDWNEKTNHWKVRDYKVDGKDVDFEPGLEVSPSSYETVKDPEEAARPQPSRKSIIQSAEEALKDGLVSTIYGHLAPGIVEGDREKALEKLKDGTLMSLEFASERRIVPDCSDDQLRKKAFRTRGDLNVEVYGTCGIHLTKTAQSAEQNLSATYHCKLHWVPDAGKWKIQQATIAAQGEQISNSGYSGLYPR